MPFQRATTVIPTSIGRIEIVLYDEDGSQGADYRVHIKDQNGGEIRVQGDLGNLVPLLAPADISWLQDFIGRMRTKATAEFLG